MKGFLRIFWEKFSVLLNMPEMKIFWILVPLLVTTFIINSFFLPPFFVMATGGFVVIIGIITFFYAMSLAKSNNDIRIERSEQHNIISSLEDAVVAYDKNFKILFFNPAAEKLFGLNSAVVVGHAITPQDVQKYSWRLLTQVVFPSLAPVMINRSEAGSYPQIIDLSFEQPELELRVTTNLIVGETGEMLGFLKIIRDRTRDISILKSKNEFVTIASHQLRGPVTNINWALEALEKDQTLASANQELVGNAVQSSRQLLNIVDDLLMVAKIEEGRFGYKFEPINLIDFADEALKLISPQAKKADVTLYLDYPQEEFSPVIADREKLTMVMENLLDNAVRYNVKNGEITVRIEKVKDQSLLQVSVKDTGIGIPAQDMNKIFTKLFRAENAIKFETEGSGLGLYIAKNIIRAHGGTMWAESELNRGSTFYFTLATDPKFVPAKEVPLEY